MKLAEALILRSDYQKRIEQLKNRLIVNAKTQEGEEPNEDPKELRKELSNVLSELKELIQKINYTNSKTTFEAGKTLADALTEREMLGHERKIYSDLIEHASVRHERYSRSEIKYVASINIKETQKYVDELSQKYRVLDTKIQELNWLTVIES
ncbi:DIP1984 family protein [Ornithinibacillus sp. 179-J 7C1 HS]|uniref:DIP1984 family protein n=1 Tax=Ornithinibacillus sp. 179-J 7C1 HS TaxID=3142384 RepID=UPI0039A37F27